MLVENLAEFMPDFGELVTWYGAPWVLTTPPTLDPTKYGLNGLQQQTALAILDQPDEEGLGKRILSRAYTMTFPVTQFVGIKRGDAVVARGINFSVLEPKSLEDGKFFSADLQAV